MTSAMRGFSFALSGSTMPLAVVFSASTCFKMMLSCVGTNFMILMTSSKMVFFGLLALLNFEC